MTQFLAAKEEDPELIGRLRNTLEGAGLGVGIDAFIGVLRGTKALRAGDRAGVEAATEEVDAAIARELGAARSPEQGGPQVARPDEPVTAAEAGSQWDTPLPDGQTAAATPVNPRIAELEKQLNDAQQDYAWADTADGRRAPKARIDAIEAELATLRGDSQKPTDAPRRASASGGAAGGGRASGESPGGAAKPSDVPPEVGMSRADVESFLDDVKFNREFSEPGLSRPRTGGLDIKPELEPSLTRTKGEWTVSTYRSPETLDATLRALVERGGKQTDKVVRSDAELQFRAKAAADELGLEPEIILAAGHRIAGLAGDIDVAVQTMRTLWRRTAVDVDAHVGKDLRKASDQEFANVVRDIHNAMTFGSYLATTKSAMGRGLRVLQLPDADTYARLVKDGDPQGVLRPGARGEKPLPVTREDAMDWLELWGVTTGNTRARQDFLHGLAAVPDQWTYLRTSLANSHTANVLSGLPSVFMNVVGPSIAGALRTVEKSTGGYAAALLERNPARRAELLTTANKAAVAYAQTFNDVSDAFQMALRAAEQGRPILGGGGSVTDVPLQFGPLTDSLIRAAGRQPSVAYAAGSALNWWPRAFMRLNNGLDEFSKRLAYLGEARIRAMVEGEAQGFRGAELQEFVAGRLASSTDDVGHAMDERLLEAAERTTLTGQVGTPGSLTARGFAYLNGARREFPELRYVLPVLSVPANALGETLRRIPGVNLALRETRDELLGHRGAVAQAEAYGRTMLGAAFMTAGFFMARAGMLTGAGPKEARDREEWLRTHEPYSILIGDQWVQYSRYDVIGGLLGIPATVFDNTVYRPLDQSSTDLAAAGAAALAGYFRDRAALRTANQLLTFGDNPAGADTNFLERLAGSTVGRIVVPNFVTQLGRNTTDPAQTIKGHWFDHVVDMVPFASRTLPARRNVFGEVIHKPQDTIFENLLPITFEKAIDWRDDPQLDELARLYETTGYAAGVTMQSDITGGYFDAASVRLEDGSDLFTAVARARGEVLVDGLTFREALMELFNSPDYEDAVDADASHRETVDGLTSRGYLVSQVSRDFNREARAEVARQSPTAARWLAVASLKDRGGAALRGYQARELAEADGRLFEALGIEIEAFEDRARGF